MFYKSSAKLVPGSLPFRALFSKQFKFHIPLPSRLLASPEAVSFIVPKVL